MLKSLKLLKKYREIFLDVTIEEPEDFDEIGINFISQIDEAIAELEALQSRSCESCKYQTIAEADCKTCSRYYRDEYEPKEQ